MRVLYYICKTNSVFAVLNGYIFCLLYIYIGLALKMSNKDMTIMSILCFLIMTFIPILIPVLSDLFLHIGLSDFANLIDVGSKRFSKTTLIIQVVCLIVVNLIRLKLVGFDSNYPYAIISSIVVTNLLYFVKCTTYGVCDVLKNK